MKSCGVNLLMIIIEDENDNNDGDCIQVANSEFTQATGQNQSPASREQKLKDLAAAFDSFTELKNNLEEGTKVNSDNSLCTVQLSANVLSMHKLASENLLSDIDVTSVCNVLFTFHSVLSAR
jgi:ALIX V-shaped domain binding to HIV